MINYFVNNARNIGFLANRMYKYAAGIPDNYITLQALKSYFPDAGFLEQADFIDRYIDDPKLEGLSEDAKERALANAYEAYLRAFYDRASAEFRAERSRTPLELVRSAVSGPDTPDTLDTKKPLDRVKLTRWSKNLVNSSDWGELPEGWRILARPLDDGGTGEGRYAYPIVDSNGIIMGKAFNDNRHTIRLTAEGQKGIGITGATLPEFGYTSSYYNLPPDKNGVSRGALRRYGYEKLDKDKLREFLKTRKSSMQGASDYLMPDAERKAKEERIKQIERDLSGTGLFNLKEKKHSPKYRKLVAEKNKLQGELAYNAYNDLYASRGQWLKEKAEIEKKLSGWFTSDATKKQLKQRLEVLDNYLARDPLDNIKIDMESFQRALKEGAGDDASRSLVYQDGATSTIPGVLPGFSDFIKTTYKDRNDPYQQDTAMKKWQDARKVIYKELPPDLAKARAIGERDAAEDAKATADFIGKTYESPEDAVPVFAPDFSPLLD